MLDLAQHSLIRRNSLCSSIRVLYLLHQSNDFVLECIHRFLTGVLTQILLVEKVVLGQSGVRLRTLILVDIGSNFD